MDRNTAPKPPPDHTDSSSAKIDVAEHGNLTLEDAIPSSISEKDEEQDYESTITSVRASDILCGRGKVSFNHDGNKHFRHLVNGSLQMFVDAAGDRKLRAKVCSNIMSAVQESGGRFLKKNKLGKWVELSRQQTKDKIGHAIRDALQTFDSKRRRGSLKLSSDTDIEMMYEGSERGSEHGEEIKEKHFPKAQSSTGFHEAFDSLSTTGVTLGAQSFDMASYHGLEIAGSSSVLNFPNVGQPGVPLVGVHTRLSLPSNQEHHEDDFQARIDAVLGPLPEDAEDPMRPLLDRYNQR